MSDFDEYIKNKYPSDYLLMTVRYPDQELSELYSDQFEVWQHQQAVIDEHTEVIKLQDADLRKYEKQIESLKAQLNNMESCYIGIKKINDEQSAIIQGHFAARQDMQKRIDAGLEKIRQFGKEGCLFPEWLTWAEKALRGEHV